MILSLQDIEMIFKSPPLNHKLFQRNYKSCLRTNIFNGFEKIQETQLMEGTVTYDSHFLKEGTLCL